MSHASSQRRYRTISTLRTPFLLTSSKFGLYILFYFEIMLPVAGPLTRRHIVIHTYLPATTLAGAQFESCGVHFPLTQVTRDAGWT